MNLKRQLIVALVFIFAFVTLTANIGSVEAATSRVAIISKLEGTVEVQKSGGKKTLKGFKNMSLNEGDVVSTGSKSSVELKFSNGTSSDDTLVLESNTTVTFSKLTNRNGTVTKVKMKSGKAWVDVKSIKNSSDDFQLETPTAVMGVRGTNFFVGIDPSSGKSVLAMFAGVVKLLTDEDNYKRSTNVYPAQIFYTANDGELLGNMSNDSIAQLLQNSTPAAIQSVIENLQKIKDENDQLLDQLHNGDEGQAELDENLQELLTNEILRTNIERITAALLKEAVDKNLITVAQQTALLTQLFGENGTNKENELVSDEKNNTYDFILKQKTQEMLEQLNKSNVLEDKKAQLLAEQERKKQALEEEKKKREQEALDSYLENLTPAQRDALLAARDRVDRGTTPTPSQAPAATSTPSQGWGTVTKPFKVIYDNGASTNQLQYSLVSAANKTFQLTAPIPVGQESMLTFEPNNSSMTITSLAINGETLSPQENGSYVWYLPSDSLDIVVTISMSHATYGNAQFKLQGQLDFEPVVNAAEPVILAQPEDRNVTVGEEVTLGVQAESVDGGTLSYQWYRSDNSDEQGTAISGATIEEYTVPTTEEGTSYYYVVVKNTNTNVNGATTATTTSRYAEVVVDVSDPPSWETLGIPFTVNHLGIDSVELEPSNQGTFEYYVLEPIIVAEGDQLDIAAISNEFTIDSVTAYDDDFIQVDEASGHYQFQLDSTQWNLIEIDIEVTHDIGTTNFILFVETRTVPEGWETIENPIALSITSSVFPDGKPILYKHLPYGYEYIVTTEEIIPTDDTVLWFTEDSEDYDIESVTINGEAMIGHDEYTWYLQPNDKYLSATVRLQHNNFGTINLYISFQFTLDPELFPVTFYIGDENMPLEEYEVIEYDSLWSDSTEYLRTITFYGSLFPSMSEQRYLYVTSDDYYILGIERALEQDQWEALTPVSGNEYLIPIDPGPFQYRIRIWDSAISEEKVYLIDEYVYMP